jgi:hypothetical protein
MTGEILRLIRKKRRLWKKAKNGQNVEDYEEVVRQVRSKIRTAKRLMEKKLAADKTANKKPFFNYIRKRTRFKDTVGPLKAANEELIKDLADMAEELNKCFSDVFTREDTTRVPEPQHQRTRSKIHNVFITTQKVRSQIKKLKPTGAAGPDGITTQLLQQCVDELSPVLATFYRKSINEGKVPQEWKTANVVPIFQKGSKAAAGNYRPISLTCISCKAMESIQKEEIVNHLDRNRIISSSQHGSKKAGHAQQILLSLWTWWQRRPTKAKVLISSTWISQKPSTRSPSNDCWPK